VARDTAGLVRFLILCILTVALAGLAWPASIPILDYIQNTWTELTRSHQDLATAAADPKFPPPAGGSWPVWVAADEDLAGIERELRGAMKGDFAKIELWRLPSDLTQIREAGLLYLPHPYVVPGGRFNEMYGWDSFFIEMGLLRDGRLMLAKDMVDNFLYEIREYGKVLNANRMYYLTRSQPPFLTQMILLVFAQIKDRKWLEETVPEIEKYYAYWTSEPHLTPETGLSRYYDSGDGPAPEVVSSERDANGRNEYDLIRQYFRTHRVEDYDVTQYYDLARDELKPLFYQGDRAMRESGFDPSNRFGPFGADIIYYNPVCLNSLLYLMEQQTAEILERLEHPNDAAKWKARARERSERINRLMWDARKGMYFDYNFIHKRLRQYPFLTTFYPMWAGFASKEQARAIVGNLGLFERPGGLQTSTQQTGYQWDAPFGWAPLEWIAVQALRRYGYNGEADRIAQKFLRLVRDEYDKHGTIVEKYDVLRRRSDLGTDLRFGYRTNEVGFGWTNAVYTGLYDELPARAKQAGASRVKGATPH
jgi:alpha,alpha-trehalase